MELSTKDQQSLLLKIKKVKWTNRYDCPPGYIFNEDGWIETAVPYPKISVNFLPYLFTKLGEYQILLQNLLALRLLNDHPHKDLEKALWNRYTQSRFGKLPDKDIFKQVVKDSLNITNTTQLPVFDEDILSMETIWYGKDFSEAGKAAIKKKLRNNYIANIRAIMPINKKYKTEEVMQEADISRYAINQYWKLNSLDVKTRTISSIVEAVEDILSEGEVPTLDAISLTSGVSTRSIQRYKDMWKLKIKI